MTMNCRCPKCRAILGVPQEYLGKKGTCNKCGSHVLLADTRVPCPVCAALVFFDKEGEGASKECDHCRSILVLTVQSGVLWSKLVPILQDELVRRNAEEGRKRRQEEERAERKREATRKLEEERIRQANAPISCPSCGSSQVAPMTKGFSPGKAIVGGLLLGPLGLVGGAIGSRQVQLACLKCGRRWDAGQG